MPNSLICDVSWLGLHTLLPSEREVRSTLGLGSFLILWSQIILSHYRTSLIGQLACELFFRGKNEERTNQLQCGSEWLCWSRENQERTKTKCRPNLAFRRYFHQISTESSLIWPNSKIDKWENFHPSLDLFLSSLLRHFYRSLLCLSDWDRLSSFYPRQARLAEVSLERKEKTVLLT